MTQKIKSRLKTVSITFIYTIFQRNVCQKSLSKHQKPTPWKKIISKGWLVIMDSLGRQNGNGSCYNGIDFCTKLKKLTIIATSRESMNQKHFYIRMNSYKNCSGRFLFMFFTSYYINTVLKKFQNTFLRPGSVLILWLYDLSC